MGLPEAGDYRKGPLAAAIHRWSTRTARAAQRELARRHQGEYQRILWDVRQRDPKPEIPRDGESVAGL